MIYPLKEHIYVWRVGLGEGEMVFASWIILFKDQERNLLFVAAKWQYLLCIHKRVKKATVDYFDMKLLVIHEGLIMMWHLSSWHLNELGFYRRAHIHSIVCHRGRIQILCALLLTRGCDHELSGLVEHQHSSFRSDRGHSWSVGVCFLHLASFSEHWPGFC